MNRETQNIEFKQSWHDDYLKWICGFANAQGGKLVIGVDDGGNTVGVANANRLLEDIPNKIVSLLGIVANVNLVSRHGHDTVEIDVAPSNVPISLRGVYHYRSGATKQELTGTALQHFILKKMGRTWDDVICEGATMADIDENAIRYFLRKATEARWIEPLEIPEDALREMIFNSIVHKDYTGVHIQLKVYNDRLVLWNEGSLPEGYSVDDLLGEHASRPRNKNIAATFYRAGFIEAWGRGIGKICDGFEKAGLAVPVFEGFGGGVRVTAMRPKAFVDSVLNPSVKGSPNSHNRSGDANETANETVNETVNVVITLVAANPGMKRRELVAGTGRSRATVARIIASLREKGLIEHRGSDKAGGYYAIKSVEVRH